MAKAVGVGGVFLKAEDLASLTAAGVTILPKQEDYDYGRFAWIEDPEGNRIELWEPKG
jgi:predicted enzyme related to lactoylglutathione lyase